MPHINILSTLTLTAGAGTSFLAIVDPQQLEGLGPTALLSVITLASLGTLVYLMKNFIPVMNELVKEIAKNTASTAALVGRRQQDADDAKRAARETVEHAAEVALDVIADAAAEAKLIVGKATEVALKHNNDEK